MKDYLDVVVEQASDRHSKRLRSIDQYLKFRRANSGILPVLNVLEFDLDLPRTVLEDPIVLELRQYIADIVLIDNDIASFNKEQAVGDEQWNLLYVVMQYSNIPFDAAMAWAAAYHTELENKFIEGLQRIPSFGAKEIDDQIQTYVHGLAAWPRGQDCWNFEGERYFGTSGEEYRKTRMVPLLPKIPQGIRTATRREDVVIPVIDELRGAVNL
ncbi:terpene cyclase [Steccherinum ochraceum]|uniref:Terpene synthase n=1 Tax=Steccherinum ochraceum TaxID=92696 RepID=A0A4R0RDE1_9APHY|nr:terpene cyclase [Steccherinum ochraceum]